MKKVLTILMVAVMVAAFVACAQQGTAPSETPTPTASPELPISSAPPIEKGSPAPTKEADAGQTAGMANPWTNAASEDEIEMKIGVEMSDPPDGATNISYSYMEADKMGQVIFTWNGDEYTYRVQKSAAPQDIAGMYVEFTNRKDIMIGDDGQTAVLQYNQGKEGVVTWYDAKDGESMSVSSPTAGDESKMVLIATEMD